MKITLAIVVAGTFIAVGASAGAAPQSSAQPSQNSSAKPAAKNGVIPPPVVVDVIAVDPKARTITVREIAAVPAPPGKPVEIKLPVAASATGQKLADTKEGEKVAVTCAVKPTVHPTADVPIVLTDCVRVIKIEPKP
jgi:hypothetical protein